MDTIQRQSIDQNLRKLAETAGFADIYTQDYSGYFKDIKDYIYLNGEKYRPQDISPINIFFLPDNYNNNRQQSLYQNNYRGRSADRRNSRNFSQTRYIRSNSENNQYRNNYSRLNSNRSNNPFLIF